MKEGFRKGTRCRICTGCGVCFGEQKKLYILGGTEATGSAEAMPAPGAWTILTDIGTTTIAMVLLSPEGGQEASFVEVNPQHIHGRDVISRIRSAEDPSIREELQRLVMDCLERGIKVLLGARRPAGLCQFIACNTTERYLLLGEDPAELGKAPFHATHTERAETVIGGVETTVLPGFSAFVGGDLYAGYLACMSGHMPLEAGTPDGDPLTLLVDLGTNGEILLGNRSRLIGCSTAAGPAFEGGPNRGVWGADMVHFTAELLRQGLADETGLLMDPYFEEGIRIGNVHVTQESIRAIQLAKAAIAAGIEILMKAYGCVSENIDRVVLAGGFGYFLKPEDAVQIGLLPKALEKKAVPGGNTALRGAAEYAARTRMGADSPAKLFPLRTEILNLAEQPDFQEIYVKNMNLVPTPD